MSLIIEIKELIENELNKGNCSFLIYPYGNVGMQVKYVLNEVYGIKEKYILDNKLCRYNINIKPLTFLSNLDMEGMVLILASTNLNIYKQLKKEAEKYLLRGTIAELKGMKEESIETKKGKHSYGPLCNHWLVESVGAFCSFAPGTDVVQNHAVQYISTSTFLYQGFDSIFPHPYEAYSNSEWYIEGVRPYGNVNKLKRITIGNDVWLGQNVLITNGSNIGNGAIAGAGAIITKDVPDYAVVVGAPARIIRYRYTLEQIDALNKIQWWNWPDEIIREKYHDFYLPIEDFIERNI